VTQNFARIAQGAYWYCIASEVMHIEYFAKSLMVIWNDNFE